jgi:hypothetical protein
VLEGRTIIVLRSVDDSGEDWTEAHAVRKIYKVQPTSSAPRGAIHFMSDGDPSTRSKNGQGVGGGFRVVNSDEICEVIPPVRRPPRKIST